MTSPARTSQSKPKNYIDRPPRIQPPLPVDEIEIPTPPENNGQNQSLIEMLLPLMTIAGYLLLALGGRGRSLLLLIPMGGAMLGSVIFSIYRASKQGEEYEKALAAYRKRLTDTHHEMRDYHQQQRQFYNYNYPDPDMVVRIARMDETSRSGPRVWERRPHDNDFGMFRLGIGTRQSSVIYKYSAPDGGGSEQDVIQDALRIARESHHVKDTAITLKMRHTNFDDTRNNDEVLHTLGIYAMNTPAERSHERRYREIYRYVRAMLAQFVTFHSPADAKLYIAGSQASQSAWEWANNLPHTRSSKESLMCFEGQQVNMRNQNTDRLPLFLKDVYKDLLKRQQRLDDDSEADEGIRLPFTLLVVDMLGMSEDSMFHDIETSETTALIMRQGQRLGAAVIYLTGDAAKIPSQVGGIIELETVHQNRVSFRFARTGVNGDRFVGTADRIEAIQSVESMATALKDYNVRVSAAASLRSTIDLLQMNDVLDVDELDILDNWQRSTTPKNAEWPHVAIGAKSGNDMRELVFEANADGVHGVIAGTTGSGKSELLLTLIIGLAVNYDPSMVNFVLVDFKGGAAFDEFHNLPHCVDIVTNLEGNAVERMFSAIKAELDRRGELIARHNVKHIVDYKRKGLHLLEGNDPFPHLFIIIDEFAEMVAENPEYKSQLDSITRLGRAIGVSLVLATQRPAGMITDQMRANMKLKICLRVETPDDSREMLRRSDAAYLPPSIPGRAYVQIGNEVPEMIQVARAGGTYRRGQSTNQARIIWLDRQKDEDAAREEVLSRVIVRQMYQHARYPNNHVAVQRKPWPNALPEYLPLGSPLDTLQDVDTRYLIPKHQRALNNYNPIPSGERPPLYLNAQVGLWQALNQPSPVWTPDDDEFQTLPDTLHDEMTDLPELLELLDKNPVLRRMLLDSTTLVSLYPQARPTLSLDDLARQDNEFVERLKQIPHVWTLVQMNTELAVALHENKALLGLLIAHHAMLAVFDYQEISQAALLEENPALRRWRTGSAEFRQFIDNNPMLLSLLAAHTVFLNHPNAPDAYQTPAPFETLLTQHSELRLLCQSNPPLREYLADYPHLALFIGRNPLIAYLLDSRPELTRRIAHDDRLAASVDASGQLQPELLDWSNPRLLHPVVGLVDQPRAGVQRMLEIDITRHVAIFGSGGWGKTTALRTLITEMVSLHHPDDLHIYIMDMGGRNLTMFEALPHVGGVITQEEDERIRRLLRFLRQEIDRRNKVVKDQASDLISYNINNINSGSSFPAIVVFIDNFAEIRESYEPLLGTFITLLREGRNVGIYFVATGDLPGSMGRKVYSLFGQRMALRLTEKADYMGIVGRGGTTIGEIWGRGLIAMERSVSPEPLEFQMASPIALTGAEIASLTTTVTRGDDIGEATELDIERALMTLGQVMTERLEKTIIQPMRTYWAKQELANLPRTIDILPTNTYHQRLLEKTPTSDAGTAIEAPVGIQDSDLMPFMLNIDGGHFVILGPPLSGRTTFLRTWILALAHRYTPDEVAMVLIDPMQDLALYGGEFDLSELPHVLESVTEENELRRIMKKLQFEYEFLEGERPQTDEEAQTVADALWQDYLERTADVNADLDDDSDTDETDDDTATETETTETETDAETVTAAANGATPPPEHTAEQPELPLHKRPEIFVFIDNYDSLEDILPGRGDEIYEHLGKLARSYRKQGLHIILCGSEDAMRDKNPLQKQVSASRMAFGLRSNKAIETLGARVPRSMRDTDLGVGRGFYIRAGQPSLVQIATLEPPNENDNLAEQVDRQVERISIRKLPHNWYYDVVPVEYHPEEEDEILPASETRTALRNVNFTPNELEITDYERNREQNQNSPLKDLLTGENLRKLTPALLEAIDMEIDMVRTLETDDDNAAPEYEPITAAELPQYSAFELRARLRGGKILLPQSIDDDLRQRISERISMYDQLQASTLLSLTPELINTIELGMDMTPQELLAMEADALQALIDSGQLTLPQSLSAETARQIEQRRTIYNLLQADTLVALPPPLLASLDMTFGDYTPRTLHEADIDELQAQIDSGELPLPDQIAPELQARIESRRAVYRQLPADLLVKQPLSVLRDSGIDFGSLALNEINQQEPDELQARIRRGDVVLPDTVEQELLQRLRRSAVIYNLLSAENLKQLTVAILDDLPLDMGMSPEKILASDIDTLETHLREHVELPEQLDPDLINRIRTRLDVMKKLPVDVLAHIPADSLQTLGIHGFTDHWNRCTESDIQERLDSGKLHLPEALDRDQKKHLRDILRGVALSDE